MAVAETRTLIPLDRVAQVLGISDLHFNGITSQYFQLEPYCDDVWQQYAWQRTDRFSREELAEILNQAEQTVAKQLGYLPVSNWIRKEEHLLPQTLRPEEYSYVNSRGMRKSISSRFGFVHEGGVRGTSAIETGASVVYDDPDGDGYKERATVTVVTALTNIEEVRVFYPGENAAEEWEIRPVNVSISGGIATITFNRSQCVLPELLNRFPSQNDPLDAVDGDDDANFLTTVDVYRVYNDTSQQITFYIEPSGCSGCDLTEASGCLTVRDSRRGFLTYWPATWDTDTETYTLTTLTGIPLRADFYYYAGLRNEHSDYPHLRMKPDLERLIIYYALTLADKAICGCDNFASTLAYQLLDIADRKNQFIPTFQQLNCPLGTRRAALNMWNYIQLNKLGSSLRKG